MSELTTFKDPHGKLHNNVNHYMIIFFLSIVDFPMFSTRLRTSRDDDIQYV